MPSVPKNQPVGRIKPKRLQNRNHLERIAGMACCCCGSKPVQCHHLLREVVRGMGLRAGDDKVIPLCPDCHMALHMSGDETAFLLAWGVDGPELAIELWEESNA